MFRLIITYCLLIAFAIVLTPKNLIHHHEDAEHVKEHHNDGKNHLELKNKCNVCDFILQPANKAIRFQFDFPKVSQYVAATTVLTSNDLISTNTLKLRGPPNS